MSEKSLITFGKGKNIAHLENYFYIHDLYDTGLKLRSFETEITVKTRERSLVAIIKLNI